MIKQAINPFMNTMSLGIEKLPKEQFVYIESTQKFYIKVKDINLTTDKILKKDIYLWMDNYMDQVNGVPAHYFTELTESPYTWDQMWAAFALARPDINNHIITHTIVSSSSTLPTNSTIYFGELSTSSVAETLFYDDAPLNHTKNLFAYGAGSLNEYTKYSFITNNITIQQAIDSGMLVEAGKRVCSRNIGIAQDRSFPIKYQYGSDSFGNLYLLNIINGPGTNIIIGNYTIDDMVRVDFSYYSDSNTIDNIRFALPVEDLAFPTLALPDEALLLTYF